MLSYSFSLRRYTFNNSTHVISEVGIGSAFQQELTNTRACSLCSLVQRCAAVLYKSIIHYHIIVSFKNRKVYEFRAATIYSSCSHTRTHFRSQSHNTKIKGALLNYIYNMQYNTLTYPPQINFISADMVQLLLPSLPYQQCPDSLLDRPAAHTLSDDRSEPPSVMLLPHSERQ